MFFGEAGQANPAATATALTRMLLVYQELAQSISECLNRNTLTRRHLTRPMPLYMTPMNRVFQELLFDSVLSFNSDDYRRLVQELRDYPSDVVNDMLFGKFSFKKARIARLTTHALRPESILGRHVLKSLARFLSSTHK